LFTDEQDIKILIDQAIFSDSTAARTRAVNQLSLKYGPKALPALKEIVDAIPASDKAFKSFCLAATGKLRLSQERGLESSFLNDPRSD
jgi:hypothetical protein